MGKKNEKIAALVESFRGRPDDARYLAYFALFNQQRFFEAHEVLEELWLPERKSLNGSFYKGLIQLAGAFVHLQKRRPQPAKSLLRLAQNNLRLYPEMHLRLSQAKTRELIDRWLEALEKSPHASHLTIEGTLPQLNLAGD
ncbi:MAG TPA: DUF309 domain-containing protein [Candidatus Dormibacteraeota bacterium]|nr:DUF309 domain-containing protein [Candidatus Dormibacteraeota bacterium]